MPQNQTNLETNHPRLASELLRQMGRKELEQYWWCPCNQLSSGPFCSEGHRNNNGSISVGVCGCKLVYDKCPVGHTVTNGEVDVGVCGHTLVNGTCPFGH